MTANTEAGFLTRVPPDPAPQGDDKRLHAALDSMRHRGLASIRSRVGAPFTTTPFFETTSCASEE